MRLRVPDDLQRVGGVNETDSLEQRSTAEQEGEREHREPDVIHSATVAVGGRGRFSARLARTAWAMNEVRQRIALRMVHPRCGLATPRLPPRDARAPTDFECEGSCHFDLR
jgi:hypothetical protein